MTSNHTTATSTTLTPGTPLDANAGTTISSRALTWARLGFSNSPARIASARNICMGLCTAFFAFFLAYQGYLTHAFQTIGINSAPSIVLAEQIRYQLAQADSLFYLAASTSGPARQVKITQARAALDQARDHIIAAATNVTYGEEELVPLRHIERSLGAYDQTIVAAAALNFDFPTLHAASLIMRTTLLHAASDLDVANFNHLEKAFSSHSANALISGLPTLLLGLALLSALLWAQFDLYRCTHRLFNVGYLVASAAAVSFSLACAFSMVAAEGSLKIAKLDAFDSVHSLWLAKSVAEQARSERALMLLTSGRSADFAAPEAAWADLSSRIAAPGVLTNPSSKVISLDAKTLLLAIADSRKFSGFLGAAFSNITFDGERTELVAAAKAWAAFSDLPPSLLISARTTPITLGSTQSDILLGSSVAFDAFTLHIDRTIAINQAVFDKEINRAMNQLRIFPALATLLLALVCAGVFFGSKPRLDEYRF